MLRTALLAELGIAGSLISAAGLYAQDTDNAGTKNLQTNAVEHAATGAYNNLGTGVLNFNGPSGAAQWSSSNLIITNAGTVSLVRSDLGIAGDVTNTGTFQINALGGIVQVDGHFTTSGTAGVVNILGGGMELIGDGDPMTSGYVPANFTNNSTASNGVVIANNRYLIADTITNASGATIASGGRLEGRTAIVNNGTIESSTATSILKGNVTNNGTINARGTVEGNVTNNASKTFTVTGNLAQTGNYDNNGTLAVTGGNLTGTGELKNASTITIANDRTVSAADIKNNTGGTITAGNSVNITGTATLENSATITAGTGVTITSAAINNKSGGTLTAGNNATITGTATLDNSATITVGTGSTIGSGAIDNKSGATMTAGSNSMITGTKLANTGTITVGANSTVRSTGTATGDDLTNNVGGIINFNGAGTSNLSSATGTIVNKGAINLNAGTILVTGNLTDSGTVAIADGATFKTGSADQTIENAMTLAGESIFNTNGFNATVSGNITGTGGLTKVGLGNLTLDGTNTFSSATSIEAGQLTLEGGGGVGNSSAVAIGAAGKLKIQDAETIGSLAGEAGSETNLVDDLTTGGNNDDTTYSGKIIGAGKLTKTGTGTMTLDGSNANTFSGGVSIENGTLVAETNEQLGTGEVNVGLNGSGAAGTLQIDTGTTQTVAGVNVDAGAGASDPRGIVNNSGTLASGSKISNKGTINNQLSTSVINGGITNENASAIINNTGTINGGVTNEGGSVNNDETTSVINGSLVNNSGEANNTGTINGGVTNLGTLNSDTDTSVINGGLTNQGEANLRYQAKGAIVNDDKTSGGGSTPGLITVAGDLVGDNTLTNKGTSKVHIKDGNFTGITTLTNESTDTAGIQIDATRTLGAAAVTNQYGSTIENSGTLNSGSVIANSGTITNNANATVNGGINNAHVGALVTNNGTINGGITQNFGTVNSLQTNSVITGGVNNSAYVNAQGQISGAIVNNAQNSFTDVTLTHAQANAEGTVTFGTGGAQQTFNLKVTGGNAVGAEGNGAKTVVIEFDADPNDVGTSSYNASTNTITVHVEGETSTTVADIQAAIINGSGFEASSGTSSGNVTSNGVTNTLSGGRDSGTALLRVFAEATGSAAQNKQVSVTNDNTIPVDTAQASVDPATGNIVVKVNGNVDYSDIADEIDDLPGFNASVTASMGDQGYKSTLDTPPAASTLTNGIFNVEGNLVADNTFTNGGHLNLNAGNLTGVTTFTNTGKVEVKDGYDLEAVTINNDAGSITLGEESVLYSSTATNNSAEINVGRLGNVVSDGNITNNASGTMNFGLGTTASNDVSKLYSGTNTIVNNGQIDVTKGTLLTTGNVSGNGTIAMGNGTTFRTGNDNQTITNSMAIASGSSTFDTDGKNASVSGAISGSGGLDKVGTGNLTLSGANTFAGPAAIHGGQLTLEGGNAIADSTAVQLNNGALVVSAAETIGSLATSSGTQTTLNTTLTTGANNTSTTASGSISGTAGLVKQGTGTMTLNNSTANTYSGGTTVSGGTLSAATNEQLGTGSVTVGAGAILNTGDNTAQTISGLSNQGTVSLGNTATLNTGSSHFNNSGTVNVGTSASIVDTGAITNSGTINFTGGTATLSSGTNSITNTGSINLNAGTVLVKGNLVGSGSINMNDGTTLRSGNANQQIANGIAVNSGTAVIDTNGNDVNLTGTISGSGNLNKIGNGALTWVGVNHGNALVDSGVMITSTQNQVGNIQIANGSGVVFNQNTTGIYSGSVTGNGTLTKDGSGIVTMTGNSAYTGGTNIVGGTLRVGSDGSGQVQSNVNVGSSGTLGGGGTIIGNVNTQQGSRIAAGNSIGILNIAGNLDATASTIENELNGTIGDLINVTGIATISGATLENQFDPTATYTTRMYRAIDAAGGVSGRFSTVTQVNAPSDLFISTYYTPTTANVVLTSMADATLSSSTSTSLLSSGQSYLTSIMDQVNGYQFGGLALVPADESQLTSRNLWFRGVGFFGVVDAVGAAPGHSANTGGGIAGVDYALDPSTRIGVAGGYTFTDLSMKNAALSNAEIESPRVNLYGAHSWEQITFSAIGGYAYHDVEGMRRLIGIGVAEGSQSQHEALANFQFTVNPTGEIHSFLPYFGVQWVHLSQEAFTESGTPRFDMSFEEANVDSLRPYFGLRYQYQALIPSGSLAVPYLFARYSQETITDSNLTNLSINGSSFTVAGVQPSRSMFGLGGGIMLS